MIAVDLVLRPEAPGDEPFLFELYASTRRDLDLVPSTALRKRLLEDQFVTRRRAYAAARPDAQALVIEVEGRPVGRLEVDRQSSAIEIVDIALIEDSRGLGIGTRVVEMVLEEARGSALAVRLRVEPGTRASAFYRRLGFVEIARTPVYVELERSPDQVNTAS